MASQVFYRKWRSQTLSELVGQPHVTQTLLNALKNGSISHAYLFCGPRGTGKTSTARILAKAVNCLSNNGRGEPCNTCDMCRAITEDRAMDVIEIDAASNRGIDDIRDLREKVNYAPSQARRKVYIIDEFHMLSKDASNALLKTLEEPPPHVIFVLATTESHKVLATILSRCQHFDFHRVSRADMVSHLTRICAAEKIKIEGNSLHLIARSSTGSMRDALNVLEQLSTFYGGEITFSQVQSLLGITGDWRAKEIIKHILNNDISAGMATLNSVNNDGLDLHQFNREMVENLRGLLLVKTGAQDAVDLTAEDVTELKALAEKAALPQILNAIRLFGQIELGSNESTSLPMELALVDCYLANEKKTAAAKETEKSNPAPPRIVAPKTTTTGIQAGGSETRPYGIQAKAQEAVSSPQVSPQPEEAVKAGAAVSMANKALQGREAPEEIPLNVPPAEKHPEGARGAGSSGKGEVQGGATPAPPMVKETAAAAPSLSSEIERLRLNWKTILAEVAPNIKRTNAIALLRSSGIKPITIENGTVVLSVKHQIYKEKMEKPEYQQVAEKIIGDYLGRSCKVRCVHDAENNHLVRAAIKMGAQITSVEEK